MQHRNKSAGAEQFTSLYELTNAVEVNPFDATNFFRVGGHTYLYCVALQIDIDRCVDHAGERLEADQVRGVSGRPPTALVFRFMSRSLGR
ncbi:hypothetical protein F0L68_29235 [Solihabitans fulvus]|uniref:Uncharacterized protein n=1 Tax=Solihabitans fulvus TaxID=1892852 RepID=A0A5B2WV07_9PSEU|nr:hypothetical protein [Solihabitans fulvus]KAA2254868.1 hypothetical protein F0L68_29235 [Solihabitans fulvus]